MIIIVDEREGVTAGYASWFDREGVAASGLSSADFQSWLRTAPEEDMISVEAVLLGSCQDRCSLSRLVRERCLAAVIAVNDNKSLDETLDLFSAGVDDVVRKPVHVKEILARITAVRRRSRREAGAVDLGAIRIYCDGRDPEVGGSVLQLPRRERRILEFLVQNRGARVTKSQIFNSVYGLFSHDIDENVVESHISKLRKRLRARLGYDPIESQRFLGYRLTCGPEAGEIGDRQDAPHGGVPVSSLHLGAFEDAAEGFGCLDAADADEDEVTCN